MGEVFMTSQESHEYSIATLREVNRLAVIVGEQRLFNPNEYPPYTAVWFCDQIRKAVIICGEITKDFLVDQYSALKQGISAIPHQISRFTYLPWAVSQQGVEYFSTIKQFTDQIQAISTTVLTPASKKLLRNLRANKSLKIMYTILIPFTVFVCFRKFYYAKHDKHNEISVKGKTVIITGAGSGIGERLAMELIKRGATVILVGRSINRLLFVAQNGFSRLEIEYHAKNRVDMLRKMNVMSDEGGPVFEQQTDKRNSPEGPAPFTYKIHWIQMDFGDISSIWRGVYKIFDVFSKIDIIINNAAIRVPAQESCETYDGLEVHFGVNYLGHFIFTNAILSYLELPVASTVKIVNVLCKEAFSSGFFSQHDIEDLKRSFDGKHLKNPYSTSKLMQYLFHIELTKQLEAAGPGGFRVFAVCPPECNTNLFRFYERSWISKIFPSAGPKAGVQSILHCLLSPKDYPTGSYFVQCTRKIPPHTYTCRTEQLASQLWNLSKKCTTQMVEKCRRDAENNFLRPDIYGNVKFPEYNFYDTISRPPYLPSPSRDIIENNKKYYNPLYLSKDAFARELRALSHTNIPDYWEQLYGDKEDERHQQKEIEMMQQPLDVFFDPLPRINETNGWMYNLD